MHYLFSVFVEDDNDNEDSSWMLETDADTIEEAFDKAKAKAMETSQVWPPRNLAQDDGPQGNIVGCHLVLNRSKAPVSRLGETTKKGTNGTRIPADTSQRWTQGRASRADRRHPGLRRGDHPPVHARRDTPAGDAQHRPQPREATRDRTGTNTPPSGPETASQGCDSPAAPPHLHGSER